MSNLSTDYDVRLATLDKLGGDMTKKYATIYDVDLAILDKTGQGGGGVTIEEVDAEIDSKLTGYATKDELNSKLDVTEVWSGTQAEWDALPVETQNNIKIALITE